MGYSWIQGSAGDTGEYWGIHGNTGGYRGLQGILGNTGEYMVIQGDTGEYRDEY